MSAVRQLSFFPELQDDLHKALDLYNASGVEHLFFRHFARRLAVGYKSMKPGACIAAACPSGQTQDELIGKFRKEVQAMDAPHPDAPYSFHPVEISVPIRFTARQMEVELLDRYTQALNSARISHRGKPRFEEFRLGHYYNSTAIGRLIAFLRTKSPDLVIIRDARNFGTPDASKEEIRAGWRLILDIAKQSGVPHIIFAPVGTVSSVIYDDPAMLSDVEAVVLKPYHRGDGGEIEAFLGVVNDYDAEIPWADKDSLGNHIGEIESAISGDVDRLRQWIVRAISEAIADPETTRITWEHFRTTTPHEKQRLMAFEDRIKALGMIEAPGKAKKGASGDGSAESKVETLPDGDGGKKSKKPVRPGRRNPGRDPMMPQAM